MTDIRIATDYLQDLFAKLAAGRQDPARVEWPFAAECWRAVCGEIERLQDRPWVPIVEHADLSERCRLMKKERDQARAERDELQEAITDLLEPCDVCGGSGYWGTDGERCWECTGTCYQPKLDADAVSVAVKAANLGGKSHE